MSFVCNACHVAGTGHAAFDRHLSQSHGSCEDCGQVTTCTDCGCSFKPGSNLDGDEAAERLKRRNEEYAVWYDRLRSESVKADGKDGAPYIYVQWKGTDVCMDFHCPCGNEPHVDGYFLYSVRCTACGRVWELDSTFLVREVKPGETPRQEPVDLVED